jgi:hypothetical protein
MICCLQYQLTMKKHLQLDKTISIQFFIAIQFIHNYSKLK